MIPCDSHGATLAKTWGFLQLSEKLSRHQEQVSLSRQQEQVYPGNGRASRTVAGAGPRRESRTGCARQSGAGIRASARAGVVDGGRQ